MARATRPVYTVVAGPNGAGKSTLIDGLQRAGYNTGPVVNPDLIAEQLRASGEKGNVELAAGRQALRDAKGHIDRGESFTRETTLSSQESLRSIATAKAAGYEINLLYVGIETKDISKSRVADRVVKDGHDIPEDAQNRRFERSLIHAAKAAKSSDKAYYFDNSYEDAPQRVVAVAEKGEVTRIEQPTPAWVERATTGLGRSKSQQTQPPARLTRAEAAAQIDAAEKLAKGVEDPTRKAVATHQIDAMRTAAGLSKHQQQGRSIARPGRGGDREQEQ